MTDFAFDVETTGLSRWGNAEIFAYCVGSVESGIEVYREDDYPLFWGELNRFFLDKSKSKIAHNYKFELGFLRKHKVTVPDDTVWHDTMIQSQLLRNNAVSHALDKICETFCDDKAQVARWRELDKKVNDMGKLFGNYSKIPKAIMTQYQINDGERTLLLHNMMYPEIESDPRLLEDYRNEIELIKTTVRLEEYGVKISKHHIRTLIKFMQDELDRVQGDVYELFGEFINLNSGVQVARVLYKLLKLPVLEFTKSGKPSTDQEIILALKEKSAHPVLDLILKQRSYTKGVAIVGGYLEYADEDGIIHPRLNTNQARTGRESSSEPNMQNVSKDETLKGAYAVPARGCFITRAGHVLLFVDYQAIELRLIIEAAQETALIQLIRDGGDPHAFAAQVLFAQRWDQASAAERKLLRSGAKNATFGIAYGAGAAKIGKVLGLTNAEAVEAYRRYREVLPKIANFTKDIITQVKENGFVVTPFGRKLFVDLDKPYAGANYLIQGMAAGILKRAQVRVDKWLQSEYGDQIRIMLPIHDEIVFSYPRAMLGMLPVVVKEISRIMCDMKEINVPLGVEWKISYSLWNKAKELTFGNT